MKTSRLIITVMVSMFMVLPVANAGDLKVPHSFKSGTKAKAAEVNANFEAVQSEVNDNDQRISAKETQLHKLGDGCAVGSAIRAIAADGSITCETDDVGAGDITSVTAGSGLTGGGTAGDVTLGIANGAITSAHIANGAVGNSKLADGAVTGDKFGLGAVSIGSAGFNFNTHYSVPTVVRYWDITYPVDGQGAQAAYGTLQIPDGVTLNSLSCSVHDSATGVSDHIDAQLYRTYLPDGKYNVIYETPESSDMPGVQQLRDTTAGDESWRIVNNGVYQYTIRIYWGNSAGEALMLYGCRVAYH